jgi:hypothetical protein
MYLRRKLGIKHAFKKKKAPNRHCAGKSRGGTHGSCKMAAKFGGHQGLMLAPSQMWYEMNTIFKTNKNLK